MDPAPAFSARGQRGGWVYRRKLYHEAFDELTRWARREFQVGWQESPGRKLRTCIGAPSWRGRPISLKRAIGTCGQVSIKRPAPAGRDHPQHPQQRPHGLFLPPPQSVLDQAAADRAASKVSVPKSISGVSGLRHRPEHTSGRHPHLRRR